MGSAAYLRRYPEKSPGVAGWSRLRGEVVDLQDVVVIGMSRLSMGHIDDEKFRGDLCHALTFLQESRYHLVRLWFADYKLLSIIRVAKDISVD